VRVFKGGCLQNLQSSLAGITGSIVMVWVGATNVLSGTMSIGQLLTLEKQVKRLKSE